MLTATCACARLPLTKIMPIPTAKKHRLFIMLLALLPISKTSELDSCFKPESEFPTGHRAGDDVDDV
jgi:hypothetical protein